MKPTKANPLLNEALKQRTIAIIHKYQTHGVAVIDKISKQEKYDLMMAVLDKKPDDRSDTEINIIQHVVSDIRFFRDIQQSMSDGEQTCFQLCKFMQGYFLPKDEVLFRQGDKGDTFWIIIKGEVSIFKRVFQRYDEAGIQPENEKTKGEGTTAETEGEGEFIEKEIVRLGSGNCFGEFALNPNKNKRRLASVATTLDTFFGFIHGDKIVDIIYKANSASFIEIFSSLKLFQGRSYELLKQFYDVSEELSFSKNNIVYNIKDPPQFVYFIKEGEFSVQVDRHRTNAFIPLNELIQTVEDTPVAAMKGLKRLLQTGKRGKFIELKILGQGECFGEEEILRQKGATFARIYRVVCQSESGQLYAIPRKQILRLMLLFPQVYQIALSQVKNKEAARQIRLQQLKPQQDEDMSPINSSQTLSSKANQGLQQDKILEQLQQRNSNTIKGSSPMNMSSKLNKNIILPSPEEGIHQNLSPTQNPLNSPKILQTFNSGKYIKTNSESISENVKRNKNSEIAEDNLKSSKDSELRYLSPHKEEKKILVKSKTENAHPSHLTLLFDESMKKKRKKKNTQSLASNAFNSNYLKDFSEKFNIPMNELSQSYKQARTSSAKSYDISSMSSTQGKNTFQQNNRFSQPPINLSEKNNPFFHPFCYYSNAQSKFFAVYFSHQPSLTKQIYSRTQNFFFQQFFSQNFKNNLYHYGFSFTNNR